MKRAKKIFRPRRSSMRYFAKPSSNPPSLPTLCCLSICPPSERLALLLLRTRNGWSTAGSPVSANHAALHSSKPTTKFRRSPARFRTILRNVIRFLPLSQAIASRWASRRAPSRRLPRSAAAALRKPKPSPKAASRFRTVKPRASHTAASRHRCRRQRSRCLRRPGRQNRPARARCRPARPRNRR